MRSLARFAALFGAVGVCVLVSSTISRRVGEISLAAVSPKGGKTQDHQTNISWLWKQGPDQAVRARNSGPISTSRPAGSAAVGGNYIDKSVPTRMSQQFLGLGGGTPALLRRITVKRQNLWTYGPAITGGKDFIGEGKVPPDVPIIGLA